MSLNTSTNPNPIAQDPMAEADIVPVAPYPSYGLRSLIGPTRLGLDATRTTHNNILSKDHSEKVGEAGQNRHSDQPQALSGVKRKTPPRQQVICKQRHLDTVYVTYGTSRREDYGGWRVVWPGRN
ncbi:hypothetical protein BYT27DRAFT_7207060 [Phlegmacium glaucopus]|nr:hypothetical protein BYT27DRAFT_7213941 [Phlegmacium glaucopus]KAF8816652.1 hypothetical protein BYT27DRAFT_7207060 [Phlegmacium glaucopus]